MVARWIPVVGLGWLTLLVIVGLFLLAMLVKTKGRSTASALLGFVLGTGLFVVVGAMFCWGSYMAHAPYPASRWVESSQDSLSIGVPPKAIMLLAVGSLLVMVWLLNRERSRPAAATMLGTVAVAVLVISTYLLLASRAQTDVPILDSPRSLAHVALTDEPLLANQPDLGTAEDRSAEPASESETEISNTDQATHTVPDRPEWVGIAPRFVGNVYRTSVVSGPFSSTEECRVEIDNEIPVIVCEYLDRIVDTRLAPVNLTSAEKQLRKLGITPDYIRSKIWRADYTEFVDSSVNSIGMEMGKMQQLHVLLEFDDEVKYDLKQRWQDSLLKERLVTVGFGSSLLLIFLGLVFGYLKIDTATKGFYTRHLQVAAGLVTIILGTIIVAAVK